MLDTEQREKTRPDNVWLFLFFAQTLICNHVLPVWFAHKIALGMFVMLGRAKN